MRNEQELLTALFSPLSAAEKTVRATRNRETRRWQIRTVVEYVAEVDAPVDATRDDVLTIYNPGMAYGKSNVIRETVKRIKEAK